MRSYVGLADTSGGYLRSSHCYFLHLHVPERLIISISSYHFYGHNALVRIPEEIHRKSYQILSNKPKVVCR